MGCSPRWPCSPCSKGRNTLGRRQHHRKQVWGPAGLATSYPNPPRTEELGGETGCGPWPVTPAFAKGRVPHREASASRDPLNPPPSHQVPSSPRLHFPRATQLCPCVSLSRAQTHTQSHSVHTAQPRPRRKPAACGQGALVLRKGFLGRALPAQVVALWDTLGALIQDRKNNKAPSAGGGRRAPSCPAISASASSRAPSDSSETEASFTSASSLPSLSTP